MSALVRNTAYDLDQPAKGHERPEDFQTPPACRVAAGNGRRLTISLWEGRSNWTVPH